MSRPSPQALTRRWTLRRLLTYPAVIATITTLALPALATNEGNIWHFGTRAGLDFNSGSPVAITGSQMNTFEGCASISDSAGNLLFYTDGITIFNRNHQAMQNGTGLTGDGSSSQSGIIVPVIGSTTLYYVFSVDDFQGNKGLAYSIVDMSLNGGLGAVTTKNTVINSAIQTERIAIAKHANGVDYWLITLTGPNTYRSYPITAAGVSTTPVDSTVATARANIGAIGYLRVSPTNDTIASTFYLQDQVDILDFDAATGQLSLRANFAHNAAYGVEFSPDAQRVYIATFDTRTITRFNPRAADVAASAELIATSASSLGALARGPDGKIYAARAGATSLGVINDPNNVAPNYVDAGVSLGSNTSGAGLPTFPNFIIAAQIDIATPAPGASTRDTTPTISGTTGLGNTVVVEVFDSAGVLIHTLNPIVDVSGSWTVDVPAPLAEGDYTVQATATNSQGTQVTAGPNAFTVDTTAPAVALITPANNAQTNDNTPTLSGTAEVGATVTVVIKDAGGNTIATLSPTVSGAGAWSIDAAALPDGAYTVEAAATDAASNLATTAPNAFVVDTVAPPVVILSPTAGTITSDDTPTVSGTTEPGATVTVVIKDAGGNTSATLTAAVDGAGAWTIDSSALPDGAYTAEATASDAANNSTTSAPVGFVVDTVAPTVTISAPVSGTITNDNTPTLSGTAEPGATLTVVIKGAGGNTIETFMPTISGAGAWTVTAAALADGTFTVEATASDAANNSASATPSSFEVDTIAPPVTSNAPTLTNDSTPTITGTSEVGATITVRVKNMGGATVATITATANGAGGWTLDTTPALAEGAYTVEATATDAAGNTSAPATGPMTIDLTPPALSLSTPSNNTVTRDNTPTVSGTAEPGATVTVIIRDAGGVIVQTATPTVSAGGDWTLDASTLGDDTYSVSVSAADAAGNTSTASATPVIIDTVAPTLSGLLPASGPTNDTTPTLSGTTEAGATVTIEVKDAGGNVVSAHTVTANGAGAFSATSAALAEGAYTVEYTAADAAGNTTTGSVSGVIIDTTAPPVALSAPVSGTITNDNTPTISGTTEAGATVTVVIKGAGGNTVATLTPVVDAAGAWTVDASALAEGPYTLEITAADAAGNTSTATGDVTIDTTAPAVALSAPANNSATNDDTPTFAGTGEPGATVTVVIKDAGGNTVETLTATPDGAGDWSVDALNGLAEGGYTVEVTAGDVAGNATTLPSTTFTVDLTPPTVVITSPGDGTFTANPHPTLTGTSEPGSQVAVIVTDGAGVVVIATTVTADPNTGVWTISPPAADVPDGPYTINTTATDAAGNTGGSTSGFTIDTTILPLTLDAPASGTATNDDTPVVSGTTAPGVTVTVEITDGTGAVVDTATVTADASGGWTYEPVAALTEGTYTFGATVSTPAGTPTSASSTATIDTTAPAVAQDLDSPTSSATPTIGGTSEPGAGITVIIRDAQGAEVETLTTTADGNGDWSVVPGALAEGDYTVETTAQDGAGNAGTVGPDTLTVDLTPPALDVTSPTDGGVVAPGDLDVTGTAEPGATVTVEVRNGDDMVVGTQQVVADASGDWSATISGLGEGRFTATTTAADEAGNTTTDARGFDVDGTVPTITVTSPADGSTTNDSTPTVEGTSTNAATITVIFQDGSGNTVATLTPTIGDDGSWTIDAEALPEGTYTVEVTATAESGLTTTESSTVTIDTTAPTTTITAPTDGSSTSDDTPTVSGDTEPGATVTITVKDSDGNTVGTFTPTVGDDGGWTVDTDMLPDGDYTIEVTSTDEAGNTATPATTTITIDTTAPTGEITSPTDGGQTNNPTTIDGTGEPGATVTITIDGTTVGTTTVGDDGTWSFTPDDDLSDGDHTVTATIADEAGNQTERTITFNVTPNAMLVGGCACTTTDTPAPQQPWLLSLLVGLFALIRRRRD